MSNTEKCGLATEESEPLSLSESDQDLLPHQWNLTQQAHKEIKKAIQANAEGKAEEASQVKDLDDIFEKGDNQNSDSLPVHVTYYGPRLIDVTAYENYNDEELLNAELKLAELMFKVQDKCESLIDIYERFLLKYNGFGDCRGKSKPSVPMCTVMKGGGFLKWSSSALGASTDISGSETRVERRVEKLTEALNNRSGKRKDHLSSWSCGEQGCQNRIAQEMLKHSMATEGKAPTTEHLAQKFVDTKYKSLSFKSRGSYDKITKKWVVQMNHQEFEPGCNKAHHNSNSTEDL